MSIAVGFLVAAPFAFAWGETKAGFALLGLGMPLGLIAGLDAYARHRGEG